MASSDELASTLNLPAFPPDVPTVVAANEGGVILFEEVQGDSPGSVSCEICNLHEARYTCPGCAMRTCSVPCVRQHKTNSGCDGKRERFAKGLRLENFADEHTEQDYRFLQEGLLLRKPAIALDLGIKPLPNRRPRKRNGGSMPGEKPDKVRKLDCVAADDKGLAEDNAIGAGISDEKQLGLLDVGHEDGVEKSDEEEVENETESRLEELRLHLPPQLNGLVREAAQRGTRIQIMPEQLSRRQENTTMFNRRKKCIMWRVEWVLVSLDKEISKKHVCSLARISEATLLRDALATVLRSRGIPRDVQDELMNDSTKFFMRECNRPANDPHFFQLKGDATLADCMKGRTVIEFPRIGAIAGAEEGQCSPSQLVTLGI